MNSCASLFLECIYTEVAQRINRKNFAGRRQRGCVCGKRRETGQSPRRPVHRLTRPVDGVCQVRTVCRRRRSGVEGGVSLWRELFAFDFSHPFGMEEEEEEEEPIYASHFLFSTAMCRRLSLSLSIFDNSFSFGSWRGVAAVGWRVGRELPFEVLSLSLSFNYACPSLLLTHHHLPPCTHTLSLSLFFLSLMRRYHRIQML